MAFAAAGYSATFLGGSVITWGNEDVVTIDPISLSSLANAIDLMRYMVESSTLCVDGAIKPGSFQARLPAWKRGQIINLAAYIREMCIDGKWSIPRGAVNSSRQILAMEAASLAGIPWQVTFDTRLETYVRRGKLATWRFVMNPPPKMPVDIVRRLA
jgi:hypothetical protein